MQIGTCTDASGTSGFETRRAESVPTSRVPQSLLRESVPTSPPHDGVPTSPPRDDVPTSPLRDDITSRNSETKLPIPRPRGRLSLPSLPRGLWIQSERLARLSHVLRHGRVERQHLPVLGCVTVSLAACNACLPSHRAPPLLRARARRRRRRVLPPLRGRRAPPTHVRPVQRVRDDGERCVREVHANLVRATGQRSSVHERRREPRVPGIRLADTTAHSVTAGFGTDESWSGCPPGRAFGSGGGGGGPTAPREWWRARPRARRRGTRAPRATSGLLGSGPMRGFPMSPSPGNRYLSPSPRRRSPWRRVPGRVRR